MRTGTARRTLVMIGAVGALLLAGCGDDDAAPGPDDTAPGGDPAATVTTSALPGFDIDPAVPDDPAELPSCDTLDTPGDRQLPSRWLAASLPDGVALATAGTTRPAATPTPGSSLQVLLATTAGRVTAEAVVEGARLDDADAPTGFDPDTTLRGVPAELGASDGTGGPAGVVTARWVEAGRSWTLEAAGVDASTVRELVERLERSDDGVSDPTGGFREVAAAPGRYSAVRTELGLAAAGASPREYGVVVEEHDSGTGLPIITGLVPRTGLVLGELDGRPALRGELEGTRVVMTSLSDGSAVYAYGAFDADELDDLVSSLERVDPDDGRLVGVPMDWNPAEGRFCRDDR